MASEAGGGHFHPDGPDEAGDSPCPTDPAVAIDEALTGEERAAILGENAPEGSPMHGAKVADLLALAYDHDAYIAVTGPFFDAPEARVLLGEAGTGASYAAITLAMAGKPLTVEAVRELLGRAGLLDIRDGTEKTPPVIADEDVAFAEESKFSGGLNTWEF